MILAHTNAKCQMLVSLTFRCDWPGCDAAVTVENVPNAEHVAGWKVENDGRYGLHLCPAHKRKTWAAVREAQFEAGPDSQTTR